MDGTDDAAAARQALLRRVMSASYLDVPVINSVPDLAPAHAVLTAFPTDRSGRRAMKRARRAAARAARRRARHPERYRVEFTDWVAIPWQQRPVEARLSDYAHHLAATIEREPAWSAAMLEDHRLRLDLPRASAEIGIAAYRLFGMRRALGAPPDGNPTNPMSAGARAVYEDHRASVELAQTALIDRVAALAEYRENLIRLRPIILAEATRQRLAAADARGDVAALYGDAARNELARDDVHDLGDSAAALAHALGAAKALVSADIEPKASPPPS